MDIAFAKEKDHVIVIYLEDMTIFLRTKEDHLVHLKRVFLKCWKYGLSLNMKKSFFVVTEGKLLGHIVSRDRVHVDPNIFKAIQVLSLS